MRKSRLLLLSVLPLLFLPDAGLCGGTDACRIVAAILSVYPPMDVGVSGSPAGIPGEPAGCLVLASAPTALIYGEVAPAEAVRGYFVGTGWEEEPRLSADGPGTVAFAFRGNDTLCRAEGGAPAWIEDGEWFMSDRYELAVECAPRPD
jgi:hypothetical protein